MNNLMELKDIFKENPAIFYMLDEVERYIEKLNNIIKSERDIRLKAIEYINTMPLTKGTEWYRIELLDILKGDNKE